MHGGGFILPHNEDDDMYCARVAVGIKGIVVDIDYAKSDEHPFPAAFNQCYAVAKWVFVQADSWGADPLHISIGGHSAGGNLSEAITMKASDSGDMHFCLQVLDFAATDNYQAMLPDGAERSKAFSMFYADGNVSTLKDPYCSPAYATNEMLQGQPDTLFVNAGLCQFKDVNERFALRIARTGAKVTIKEFPLSHHGFTVRMLDDWQEAQKIIVEQIRYALENKI
jgi:acetyl esterase